MNFSLFRELLGEDSTEEIAGEDGEEKKGNDGHDKEGDVDSIREGPEGTSEFFSPRDDDQE